MCLSASTHTVGLHVVPEHQAPHVVLCGASGARFEEVAEETGVVLLEVGLDQLLHLVVDPGAIRVIYQTVIVHTVHLVHPQPGGGEGEGQGMLCVESLLQLLLAVSSVTEQSKTGEVCTCESTQCCAVQYTSASVHACTYVHMYCTNKHTL